MFGNGNNKHTVKDFFDWGDYWSYNCKAMLTPYFAMENALVYRVTLAKKHGMY